MSRSTLSLALVAAMMAGPASAGELHLEIANGLVTIVATDTPLRQILAEWAKVGGTRFVNAERVAGPPVTLQLQQVPEQQALTILLRSVAGYLAAPRRAGGTGASQYDSVMILATSTPPATPTPPAAAARGQVNPIIRANPPQMEMLERQQVMPEDGGQIASDGFITVGSAPAPRQPTPAGTGPMGSAFPSGFPMPGNRPPPGSPPPSPSTVQPGVMLPVQTETGPER